MEIVPERAAFSCHENDLMIKCVTVQLNKEEADMTVIPENYHSELALYDTQRAIERIKHIFLTGSSIFQLMLIS